MSEAQSSSALVVAYASAPPEKERPPTLVRIGGWAGLAGVCAGLAILLAGCAGLKFERFAFLPVYLGGLGLLVSIVGGLLEWRKTAEDTAILMALFVSVLSIVGGLLEMAVGNGWALFPK